MTDGSIHTRKLQTGDIPEAMCLVHAEGWNQTERDWQILIEVSQNVCVAAEISNKLVGTATAINYNKDVAWIGMVLVDRKYRGRGISKILLSSLLDNLKMCKTIKLDATPAGQVVYEKLGFKEEYKIHRMLRVPGAYDWTLFSNDKIPVQLQQSRMEEVVLFDEKVFGVNRGMLLTVLADTSPELSRAITEEEKIAGYALGRVGSRYVQIGPVSAGSIEGAKSLVSSVLKLNHQHPIVADVMDSKKELVGWLESVGFSVQRSFSRMYLGENLFSGIHENQFLICGPEFG